MSSGNIIWVILAILLVLFLISPAIVFALAEGAGGMIKAVGAGFLDGLLR